MEKSNSNKKEFSSFLNINKGEKLFGMLLALISILLFFSIFSYITSFKIDQSIAIEGWDYIKKTEDYKIQNWINKIGVYIGYLFVDKLFGVLSFLIPISIFILSFNFILQHRLFSYVKVLFYPILFILLGSSLLSFLQLLFDRNPVFSFGGGFGETICGKGSLLHSYLGVLGIFILWVIISFTSLIVFFDLSFDFVKEWIIKGQMPKDKKIFVPYEEETVEKIKKPTPDILEEISYSDTLFEKDQIAFDFPKNITENEPQFSIENEVKQDVSTDLNANLEIENIEPVKEVESKSYNPSLEIIPINEVRIVSEIDSKIQENYDKLGPYDPRKDLENYKFPSIDLLENHGSGKLSIDKEELESNKNQIIETLRNFNISISSIRATVGPTVTLYEITPSPGVRVSTISRLENDIALSLAALGIRIIAPIPGKGTIGIEVPNKNPEIVSMKSAIQSEKFQNSTMELPLVLGKNISNEMVVEDLATMPHLLMAGATGKGKSVGINSILISLLYKKHPSELKFVLIDPKKVELSIYSTIEKHFLAKLPNEEEAIITDVKKVVNTLNSLCIEMDDRYDLLKKAQVRNIKEYNQKFIKRQLNPLNGHRFLPYFVLVIDEYADLIITAGKEIEMPIARLAQLARAIGIHIIIATQRPAANIITGLIRANFPTKISFQVSKSIDSNIILDTKGAEQLIGRGDMLLAKSGGNLIRIQCPFVDTPEVDRVGKFIQSQQSYGSAYDLPEFYGDDEGPRDLKFDKKDLDLLFEEAAREIVMNQIGSVSILQRKLSIGHGRAGRIVDQLEAMGIVGPNKGSKPRDVNFSNLEELDYFLENMKKQ